jgi:hypothetical protein
MSSRYAAGTEVSSSRSRDEIERTLTRYGAVQFIYGWDGTQAIIGFAIHERQVKFVLPMPDKDSREFTHTPARGNRRSDTEIQRAYEQAVKQRWRALALVIKAKLEAVAAGIVTFEDEFAMHMILPDGRTVRDHVLPAIENAYTTGSIKPFLAIGGSS